MRRTKRRFYILVWAVVGIMLSTAAGAAVDDLALRAHVLAKNRGKLTLRQVPVPEPPQLREFVVDKRAAVALGKALYWDMQAGGDGMTACASCHFHAGADSRTKNQINPGVLGNDLAYGTTATGGGGPNYTVKPEDFPFDKLLNDVVSSQGVFLRTFDGVVFNPADSCPTVPDPTFQVGGTNVRRVEPRNTPTTINAVFNHRNFWDGRANDTFNGQNPGGIRDANAKIAVWNPVANSVAFERLVDTVGKPLLINASLASQAVGPPLSIFEMSCGAPPVTRSFPDLGRKLLLLRPLAKQKVDATDSVLGGLRHTSGLGLSTTYAKLISQAFNQKYWGFKGRMPASEYTQMEANFPLFWGLAIQLYEAVLVSGETPYDRWAAGDNNALTDEQKLGLMVFSGFETATQRVTNGNCIACHTGPEFTSASVRLRACPEAGGAGGPIERMVMADFTTAVYDTGFYNIGVRATNEDLGVGEDTLSFARQVTTGNILDTFCFDTNDFEILGPILPNERAAVNGAFKVPTLRNVELTAPYFHSGGHATLKQVVEFYDSGAGQNGCGVELGFHEENIANLSPDIVCLGLTEAEESGLIAFMKALTDERVRYERSPFDHPQLFMPNGSSENEFFVAASPIRPFEGEDTLIEIPAVGRAGRPAPGNFLDVPESF